MELYEAKDLPSADLSNQHVDDDSNSEVKRLGVPKVNGFFIIIQFSFSKDLNKYCVSMSFTVDFCVVSSANTDLFLFLCFLLPTNVNI
jgi:hypothetical protein